MNTTIIAQLPRKLVERLFNEDHAGTSGQSQLSAQERDCALTWFRRILIDFSALDEHIALLQQLYDAPFSYSRPGSRLDLESMTTAGETNKFRYHDRLPESQVTEILNNGAEGLLSSNREGELRQLLLNPVALYDLFDVIDEIQPDYWLGEMTELAKPMFSSTTDDFESRPLKSGVVASPEPAAATPNVDPVQFWPRLQQTVLDAIKLSNSSEPIASAADAPTAASTKVNSRSSKWIYASLTASTAFACAASLAAVWTAAHVNNSERNSSTVESVAQPDSVLHQGNMHLTGVLDGSSTLQAQLRANRLKPSRYKIDPKESLKKIEMDAEPALRALIALERNNGKTDLEILDYLRSLVEPDDK